MGQSPASAGHHAASDASNITHHVQLDSLCHRAVSPDDLLLLLPPPYFLGSTSAVPPAVVPRGLGSPTSLPLDWRIPSESNTTSHFLLPQAPMAIYLPRSSGRYRTTLDKSLSGFPAQLGRRVYHTRFSSTDRFPATDSKPSAFLRLYFQESRLWALLELNASRRTCGPGLNSLVFLFRLCSWFPPSYFMLRY